MPPKGFQPSSTPIANSLAPYVRTMPVVIDAMLKLANVSSDDVVYDLGCGDGRIVLAAAAQYGASGMGFDIDPECIKTARERAKSSGLEHLVSFKQQDLLTVNLSVATVVTLYLLPESNLRLKEKLQSQLNPGTRILSHSFHMGDWQPDAMSEASDAINTYPIYLWRV
ncbi:MAG: methyltransferase domain-containing protein [Cyanobacteria bacterium P01_E01_bin.34]